MVNSRKTSAIKDLRMAFKDFPRNYKVHTLSSTVDHNTRVIMLFFRSHVANWSSAFVVPEGDF